MEDKKLHPVVELMLARMESHPEEFRDEHMLAKGELIADYGRWYLALRAIKDNGSEQDIEALNEALGAIRMEQVYEWALDELLNGEARRAKEKADREYYKQQAYKQQAYKQQAYAQQTPGYLGTLAGTNTAVGASTTSMATSLQIGNETINEGLIKNIKKVLGI
jgi:antitoxin component HigA of HigAB toxin-antitoxin module